MPPLQIEISKSNKGNSSQYRVKCKQKPRHLALQIARQPYESRTPKKTQPFSKANEIREPETTSKQGDGASRYLPRGGADLLVHLGSRPPRQWKKQQARRRLHGAAAEAKRLRLIKSDHWCYGQGLARGAREPEKTTGTCRKKRGATPRAVL